MNQEYAEICYRISYGVKFLLNHKKFHETFNKTLTSEISN